MSRHLIVVASPFQLLCATELVLTRGWNPEDTHLVILPPPNDRAGEQINSVATLIEWPSIERPRWAPPAAASKRLWLARTTRRFRGATTVVIGAYQLAMLRHLASAVRPGEVILVDDGSVTPAVERYRRAQRRGLAASATFSGEARSASRSRLHRLAGVRTDELEALTYFSIYRLRPERPDWWHRNSLDAVARLRAQRRTTGDETWVLGSTLSHERIISEPTHRRLVADMVQRATGPVRYVPHRHEPTWLARWVEDSGAAEVTPLDRPVELALLDADVLPKSIVCTASTAVDVLATLFSDEVAVTAVLPDQADVRPPARRNMAEMRRRFRDDHPHVEVVALRRADGTTASQREAAGCRSRHPAPEDATRLEATL